MNSRDDTEAAWSSPPPTPFLPPPSPTHLQVTDLDFWLSNAPVPSNTQVESPSLSLSLRFSPSHDSTRFLLLDRPLRFHWLPVMSLGCTFFFFFHFLSTPAPDYSRVPHAFFDVTLLSQVTRHITLLSHPPASLCFLARWCVCACVFVGTGLTKYFSSAYVGLSGSCAVATVVSVRLRWPFLFTPSRPVSVHVFLSGCENGC